MKRIILLGLALIFTAILCISALADGETPVIPAAGDFDGDGFCTVADVLTVLRSVLNETALPEMDLSGDGKVGLVDVLRLLKIAAQPEGYHTVLFYAEDGVTLLSRQTVPDGGDALPPAAEYRENYRVDFGNYTGIRADVALTLRYIRQYTVCFYDGDGVLFSLWIADEDAPFLPPEIPVPDGYRFDRWEPEIAPGATVQADAEYTAQMIRQYTVRLLDWDGSLLKSYTMDAGSAFADLTDLPEPARDGYTFTGWDDEYTALDSDRTLTAQYTANFYTVTFKMPDGSEIGTADAEYGSFAQSPAFSEDFPETVFDWENTRMMTFSGWDPENWNITEDCTLTAKYDGEYAEPVLAAQISDSKMSLYLYMPTDVYLYALDFGFSWKPAGLGIQPGGDGVTWKSSGGLYKAADHTCVYKAEDMIRTDNKNGVFRYSWYCGQGHRSVGHYFDVCEVNFEKSDGQDLLKGFIGFAENCKLIYGIGDPDKTTLEELRTITPIILVK